MQTTQAVNTNRFYEIQDLDQESSSAAALKIGALGSLSPLANDPSAQRGMVRLVQAVQQLSLARDLDAIMAIVRTAARELTGADGATFVLRDGEFCYYADEDAIAPLWKGQRFPLERCVSGWSMLNRQPAVIEDIYADPRIPADAYRPTFVKSLAMVPIRTESPIGAIGNYWARRRLPTSTEIELLQALANTTSVAIENVTLLRDLEQRVADRTARLREANLRLESANDELECFAHAAAHDLGAPLRGIAGFAGFLRKESEGVLSAKGQRYLGNIETSAAQMREIIDDLLRLAKVGANGLKRELVDVSAMATEILRNLTASSPERKAETRVDAGIQVLGDPGLLRIVLENLLSNAWKYSGKRECAVIEVKSERLADGTVLVTICDNGVGFAPQEAEKLFRPFHRLHNKTEFPGTGVGLTTVKRIIDRHGGKIWIEGELDKGAVARFTAPQSTQ